MESTRLSLNNNDFCSILDSWFYRLSLGGPRLYLVSFYPHKQSANNVAVKVKQWVDISTALSKKCVGMKRDD